MLRLDDNKYFSQSLTYGFWLLMAFQAGYVNVGGFFVSGSFVSHVTGTSSRIGMGVSDLNLIVVLTFLTVLIAFISGAAFSGYHIGRRQESGLDQKYTLVLSVKAIFFGLVLILSTHKEDMAVVMTKEYVNLFIIFFLSFCCGVQNATCALSTGGFLKPTHMTGLSTDIGIFLTKVFAWKKSDRKKYHEEIRKNKLRMSILFSFIFGGIVASLIFQQNGHYGFFFPFASSICFLFMGLIRDLKKNFQESFSFQTAKGSVWATFVLTLLFGINAFISI